MLLEKVLFIDGLPRSGKSALSNIVRSYKNFELLQFCNFLEYIIPGIHLGKIDLEYGRNTIIGLLNERIYSLRIGRNLNFRVGDQTCVIGHPLFQDYEKVSNSPEGDVALERIKQEPRILPIQTHNMLVTGSTLNDLNLDIHMIQLIRNPIEIIYSLYKKDAGMRLAAFPRSTTPFFNLGSNFYPWYAGGDPQLWVNSDPLDRLVLSVDYLYKKMITEYTKFNKNRILLVNHETLKTDPHATALMISDWLNVQMLENIDFNVRESKLPRDLDTRGFEKKLSFLKANVKKSNLNLITNLIESHNQFILSNFID